MQLTLYLYADGIIMVLVYLIMFSFLYLVASEKDYFFRNTKLAHLQVEIRADLHYF